MSIQSFDLSLAKNTKLKICKIDEDLSESLDRIDKELALYSKILDDLEPFKEITKRQHSFPTNTQANTLAKNHHKQFLIEKFLNYTSKINIDKILTMQIA